MQEVPANSNALNSLRNVWFEPQGMRERFGAHVTAIPLGEKPLQLNRVLDIYLDM